jgi:aerobic carbon-monoxide dehydrogenase medium subunit
MKPPPFEYRRCASVTDALDALAAHGDDAVVLAGGQSLVPMLNLRLAQPALLLDIFHCDELRFVGTGGPGLTLGATTTQRAVETAEPGVLTGFEVLREAATWVGHYPIRTRGTVGGSVAHADPAAEWPLVAATLDAEMRLVRAGGERWVPAASFFRGFFETAREDDELLTEIRFPSTPDAAVITEHARRDGDFGIVLVAAAARFDGTRIRAVNMALGGVDSVPRRLPGVERSLAGATLDEATIDAASHDAAAAIDPPTDAQATAAYRTTLTRNLVRRCLQRLRAAQQTDQLVGA